MGVRLRGSGAGPDQQDDDADEPAGTGRPGTTDPARALAAACRAFGVGVPALD
ncbi:hypothetical protein [Streptomyces sp. CBMA123]|uniref:hypothetical protein n=1 Tax=Streptomyces sp. CBMA123 TaxID=1896313 RepID=UPI0016621592|nr:hypothetical protein [Streptomyces sp. CBMA123]